MHRTNSSLTMRSIIAALFIAVTALPARAHFLWVVPEADGHNARVIVSETLAVDPRVDIAILTGAKLQWRDAQGRDVQLTLTRAGHVFTVPVQSASGVVHGYADLGVRPSGERVYRLHYYPKTIVGNPFAAAALGDQPIEIVPTGSPSATRLKVLVAGKPAAGVDVNLVLPDGSDDVVSTGADGLTDVLPGRGRYGAWARHWEQIGGTLNGKPFDHTRHYAMLVFDTTAPAATDSQSSNASASATRVAALPEKTSSFGAVVSNGWLYVYGGHVVRTHQYSTESVSGRFGRLKLADKATWETLPAGTPVQGMNLAAYEGKVFRVGGMQPTNKPGEPEVTQSIADVARFDPASGAWQALPALPMPRSSHDVVVVGHQLIVVGGWALRGKQPTEWATTIEMLDLATEKPEWKSVPQPFKRRAFIATAFDDKIYVLGGFDDRSRVVRGTSIYDVARGTWSEGPALPGGPMNGFGPAAAVVGGRLYLSVDDGSVHRLNVAGTAWEPVGKATPRIVHRLVADGDDLLILGGAAKGDNSDLVERLPLR